MHGKNYTNSNYQDRELKCVECNATFTFSAGEQDYFAQRAYRDPKRCRACRDKRKQEQAAQEASRSFGG